MRFFLTNWSTILIGCLWVVRLILHFRKMRELDEELRRINEVNDELKARISELLFRD